MRRRSAHCETTVDRYTKYINSIGMLDSHSDTAHVEGWQFVTSLVESKAPDSSSARMVQKCNFGKLQQIMLKN
jgi:hypothetical protein